MFHRYICFLGVSVYNTHFWYTGDSSLVMYYFLKHFEEFTAQDACFLVRTGKLINTNNVVFVCVCVRVLSVCILYRMSTHLVNNNAYICISAIFQQVAHSS